MLSFIIRSFSDDLKKNIIKCSEPTLKKGKIGKLIYQYNLMGKSLSFTSLSTFWKYFLGSDMYVSKTHDL